MVVEKCGGRLRLMEVRRDPVAVDACQANSSAPSVVPAGTASCVDPAPTLGPVGPQPAHRDVVVMVCTTCQRLHGSSRADQPLTCPVPRDAAYARRLERVDLLVHWPLGQPSQLDIC